MSRQWEMSHIKGSNQACCPGSDEEVEIAGSEASFASTVPDTEDTAVQSLKSGVTYGQEPMQQDLLQGPGPAAAEPPASGGDLGTGLQAVPSLQTQGPTNGSAGVPSSNGLQEHR